MADYTDNALLASIKALNEVVLPALNPADPLAGEQLRLVTGFLKFLRARLPLLHDRARFELEHNLGLGLLVAADARRASETLASRLDAAIAQARAVLDQPVASAEALREATTALTQAISGLARVVATAEPDLRRRVEQAIVGGSRAWVDMQRAWFVPQGFELHADELPPLAEALRPGSHAPA